MLDYGRMLQTAGWQSERQKQRDAVVAEKAAGAALRKTAAHQDPVPAK